MLESQLSSYFVGGLALSTLNTYTSAKRRLVSFCQQLNLTPLPASQHTVALFVTHLSQAGLWASSIQAYIAAICHLHMTAGQAPPPWNDWHQLHYVMRGIRRAQSITSGKKSCLPITTEVMQSIQAVLLTPSGGRSAFVCKLLWAACCLGFFGFLRAGEFVATRSNGGTPLMASDIAVDSHSCPSTLRVFIRRAKADPFGKGIFLYLGRTHKPLCPVLAVLNYMAVRPPGEGPLLIWNDGSPLSRDQFLGSIKSILVEANIDPTAYSGHSFRIGAATSAAASGIPDHMIKLLGRWQSEAYQLYIRTPQESLASVFTQLATTRTH